MIICGYGSIFVHTPVLIDFCQYPACGPALTQRRQKCVVFRSARRFSGCIGSDPLRSIGHAEPVLRIF
jgi:hypothetical protein